MAVHAAFFSVIVRNSTLEERFPGGVAAYAKANPGLCTDGMICRVGFMGDYYGELLASLRSHGIRHTEGDPMSSPPKMLRRADKKQIIPLTRSEDRMAELTLTAFLSLDGVMQAPGGPTEDPSGSFPHGGWVVPHFDADAGTIMDGIFARADAFLLGRTTYDIFSAYFPKVTDPGDTVASRLNTLPKFVASRTRSTFGWNGSSHLENVVKEVPGLKRRFAREVQVHGSCGLAQTLIEHDLVDEYRLLTFPAILGTGRRLFGPGAVPASVELVRSSTTSAGVVVSVYRRAGSLKTGSIEMPDAGDSAT